MMALCNGALVILIGCWTMLWWNISWFLISRTMSTHLQVLSSSASLICTLVTGKWTLQKTGFWTKHGLYEFKCMLFGLYKALAMIHKAINPVGLLWNENAANFGIYRWYSHSGNHLQRVFGWVTCFNLKLKAKKCEHFCDLKQILLNI